MGFFGSLERLNVAFLILCGIFDIFVKYDYTFIYETIYYVLKCILNILWHYRLFPSIVSI